MKRPHFMFLWGGMLLLLVGCAGVKEGLKEPENNGNLIIGSVIFENSGYHNLYEIYTSDIEVAVIGYYKEDGKEKLFGKWVYTDENGYFFIANVPDGRYALKAIRVNLSGRTLLTIANEFKSAVDAYQIQPKEEVVFSGRHFNTRPRNRIVNLKHNYFTVYPNREIRYGSYDMIRGFKTAKGDILERPLIFKYFLEKFPASGWKTFLGQELSRYE